MIKLRKLKENEFNLFNKFAPEDWDFNIEEFLTLNFNKPYFDIVIAELDKQIVGLGNVMIFKDTAWLGNIIVDEDFRSQGIGRKITEELINIAGRNNCKSILLIATEQGEGLYKKLGFKISSYYEFYRGDAIHKEINSGLIQNSCQDHYSKILELDEKISGEERGEFLKYYLGNSKVFKVKDRIEGFYLPDYSNGLIIAESERIGLQLLKLRCTERRNNIVIPEKNESAKMFLDEHGYNMYSKAPRMYLGSDVEWKPECVFSRGSGYAG